MPSVRIVALLCLMPLLAACMTLPGARAVEAGDYDRAIRETSAALEKPTLLGNTEAGIYQLRGIAHLFKQEYDLALMDLGRSIELVPAPDAYSNIGAVYLLTDRPKQAIDQFSKALELNSRNALDYVNRGVAYRRDGQYDRAISDYTEALRREPRNVAAYRGRAFAYWLQGRGEQALSDAEAVVKIAPNDAQSYSNRCGTLHRLSRLQEALLDCEKAVLLAPSDAATLRAKAYVLLELHRYKEADMDFDASLRMEPMNPDGLFGRGTARNALGNASAGNADIEVARSLDPRIAETFGDPTVAVLRAEFRLRSPSLAPALSGRPM